MNEILCKGIDMATREWVEGFYVCLNGNEHRIYTGYAETDCGDYYPDYHKIVPKSACLFTGFIDRNGKKIFACDTLRCEIRKVDYDYNHPILDFDKGTFSLPKLESVVVKNGIVKWCEDLLEFRIHFYSEDGSFEYRLTLRDSDVLTKTVIGNAHNALNY